MKKESNRVRDAQAFVLHATDWSESSLIAQVFARQYGIVSVVAKGAKRPYSVLRPVLMHFQPLALSWSGRGEVKTLTRAEFISVLPLKSSVLMSAWYMSELILRFVPKEDPCPSLYDSYGQSLMLLANGHKESTVLRRFEWNLLQETGYGTDQVAPDFDDISLANKLRNELRQRLEQPLDNKNLSTRRVLMSLKAIE